MVFLQGTNALLARTAATVSAAGGHSPRGPTEKPAWLGRIPPHSLGDAAPGKNGGAKRGGGEFESGEIVPAKRASQKRWQTFKLDVRSWTVISTLYLQLW